MRHKKEVYYVQTEEEMKAQLLDAGLTDAVFEPGDGRTIKGKEMERLCRTLAALEESLLALERRGISLRAHAMRRDPATGRLPIYHVFLGQQEHWFTTREKLDEFVAAQEQEVGEELDLADDGNEQSGEAAEPRSKLHIVELHEVRSINNQLAALREMGFEIDSLIPQERTGVEEPRYRLRRGELVHRPGRPSRPVGGHPRGRRKGPASDPLQGPGRNERRGASRNDARPGQPHAVASEDGRRQRRRRPVPHPHGRQGRAPPRVHRKARAGGEEPGCRTRIIATVHRGLSRFSRRKGRHRRIDVLAAKMGLSPCAAKGDRSMFSADVFLRQTRFPAEKLDQSPSRLCYFFCASSG